MDRVEAWLTTAVSVLARLLDPLMWGLARLDFVVRGQLVEFKLPFRYIGPAITATWVVVLFLAFRLLPTPLRALLLALVALVLLKSYGYMD